MQEKIKTYIGFAVRAKKVCIGETVLYKIKSSKSVKVVLVAKDASISTIKKYVDKLNYYNTKYFLCSSKEELGSFLKKDEVAALGIEDSNLANQIINLIKEDD